MIALPSFLLAVLVSPFRSNSSLVAENVLLRHQVMVLRRNVKVVYCSPMAIAGSLCSSIAGFLRSSTPWC